MLTRRDFLKGCSTLTLAASLAPISLVPKSSRTGDLSLDQISFDTFLGQQGTIFRAWPGSAPAVRLKLIEVQEYRVNCSRAHMAEDAANEKFSLLFRGSDSRKLEQNTYVFEHDNIGRFSMFIVPLRAGKDQHNYYQAIFNRLPC